MPPCRVRKDAVCGWFDRGLRSTRSSVNNGKVTDADFFGQNLHLRGRQNISELNIEDVLRDKNGEGLSIFQAIYAYRSKEERRELPNGTRRGICQKQSIASEISMFRLCIKL